MSNRKSAELRDRHSLLTWIVGSVSVLAALVLLSNYINDSGIAFRPFVWRPMAAAVALAIMAECIVVLLATLRVKSRPAAYYWIVGFSVINVLWLLATLLQMLSPGPEAASFWQGLLPVPAVLVSVTAFYFALSYVDDRDLPQGNVLRLVPLLATVVIVYIAGATNYIESHIPLKSTEEYWGYQSGPGELQTVVYGWGLVLMVAALLLLVRHYRATIDPLRRKQALVFIVGFALYIGPGVGIDFGAYYINPHLLPPLSFVYTTMLSLIIVVGLLRYGLLQISAASQSQVVLENLSEAVIGLNGTGGIEFTNATANALLGYGRQELIGRNVAQFFEDDVYNHIQRLHTERAASQLTIEYAHVLSGANKSIPVAMTVSPVYNDRQVVGSIVALQNLTELRKKAVELERAKADVERQVVERTQQLHEEQAKLVASIQSLRQAFLLVDVKGRVLMQNHAVQAIFGTTKPLRSITDTAGLFVKFNLATQCARSRSRAATIETNDIAMGDKILRVFTSPVMKGADESEEVLGVVVLVEDFTEAKVLERSRDEFFSIASHELRTPLTAIRGNSSMLLSMYPELAKNDDAKGMVDDIHSSSERLIGIVNDFLDVSRLEQGKMLFDIQPIAIDRAIENVAYEMKTIVREKHLSLVVDHLTLDVLPKVMADENRVKQVLYNLIGNAIIYTDSGSVTVSATCTDSAVTVRVHDTGRGIAPEDKKYLFHKFQQATGNILTRDSTRGTGLGLYISKLMIEKMGGQLKLDESAIGKGSTFSFTLPIAK